MCLPTAILPTFGYVSGFGQLTTRPGDTTGGQTKESYGSTAPGNHLGTTVAKVERDRTHGFVVVSGVSPEDKKGVNLTN